VTRVPIETDAPKRGSCAIFDIDGTLADCGWRAKYLDHANYNANSKDRWDRFFAGIPQDKPIMPLVEVLLGLKRQGFPIVLCTGRSRTNEKATRDWFAKYDIPYDALYMREADCYRPDAIVKGELLDKILADGWAPFIVFDDRQAVVDMWRARGLVCAQVAKGDY
jgi:hypothetical protein